LKFYLILFLIAASLSLAYYTGIRIGERRAWDDVARVQGIINGALDREREMNATCNAALRAMHKHMAKERKK
jgi:hypothetical protein